MRVSRAQTTETRSIGYPLNYKLLPRTSDCMTPPVKVQWPSQTQASPEFIGIFDGFLSQHVPSSPQLMNVDVQALLAAEAAELAAAGNPSGGSGVANNDSHTLQSPLPRSIAVWLLLYDTVTYAKAVSLIDAFTFVAVRPLSDGPTIADKPNTSDGRLHPHNATVLYKSRFSIAHGHCARVVEEAYGLKPIPPCRYRLVLVCGEGGAPSVRAVDLERALSYSPTHTPIRHRTGNVSTDKCLLASRIQSELLGMASEIGARDMAIFASRCYAWKINESMPKLRSYPVTVRTTIDALLSILVAPDSITVGFRGGDSSHPFIDTGQHLRLTPWAALRAAAHDEAMLRGAHSAPCPMISFAKHACHPDAVHGALLCDTTRLSTLNDYVRASVRHLGHLTEPRGLQNELCRPHVVTFSVGTLDISNCVTLYGTQGRPGMALCSKESGADGAACVHRITPSLWAIDDRLCSHFCVQLVQPIDAMPHQLSPMFPAAGANMRSLVELVRRSLRHGVSSPTDLEKRRSDAPQAATPSVLLENQSTSFDAFDMNIDAYGSIMGGGGGLSEAAAESEAPPTAHSTSVPLLLASFSVHSMQHVNLDSVVGLPRFTAGMASELAIRGNAPHLVKRLFTTIATRYGVDEPLGRAMSRLLDAASSSHISEDEYEQQVKRTRYAEERVEGMLRTIRKQKEGASGSG